MRAERWCCAIRWTIRAVNDQLGYWAVMRLIETGIERDAPVQIPAGQGQFVFWREESRRLQRLG